MAGVYVTHSPELFVVAACERRTASDPVSGAHDFQVQAASQFHHGIGFIQLGIRKKFGSGSPKTGLRGGQDRTVRVWDARPWTPQLRMEQEARNLINLLYANLGQRAKVIRRIEQDPALSAELRLEALEMTKRWMEEAR